MPQVTVSGETPNTSSNTPYVSPDKPSSYIFKQHLTWRNPFLIAFIIVFAAFGVYLILNSSADSVTETKLYSTAADWNSGTLSDTLVTGNSVGLAQAASTLPTNSSGSTSVTNLALNRPAYASSTNTGNNYTETAQIPLYAKYVDDGSLTTRWGSKYSDPQWIYEDLGATYNISGVKLNWETAYGKAYEIQTSNNAKQWTTIYSTTTGSGGVNNLTGLSGSGRYVRMYGLKRGTQWGYSLWEMAVYGTPTSGTTTTTPTPTITYDSAGSITLGFNATASATWSSLTGQTTLPSGTDISYKARTSSDDSTWSAWTTVPSSGSLSGLAASQYIQLEANLSTSVTTATPLLNQLTLTYAINVANPTVSLTSSSSTLAAGSSATLSWTSANATNCTASGSWSGSQATSGSVTVTPTATSTYNLSCSGTGGTTTATPVTITVTTPTPPTTSSSGGCTSGSTVAPCVGGATTGASGWGTPIFDDEFNGTGLDTTKWSTGWFGSGITGGVSSSEQDCYDPAQVTESGGELDLTLIQKTETCDSKSQPYATGFVTTDGKFSYTYGFAEARMWLPGTGSIADWPSFWQDGQSWPTDGELDVLEGLGGGACGHWHGPTSGSGVGWNLGTGCSSATYTGGWHTFGVDWTATSITWYYDGQAMGSVSAAQASQNNNSLVGEPQYLIMGMGAAPTGTTVVAPATQRVDYVRVWQ